MQFGFINVLKPPGMTSHDVVVRVRRLTRVKRSGHGGTLDPLAEGVLPMALGQACRLIDFLPSDKTYYAEILFGKRTATDDLEGEVLEEKDASHITQAQIESALTQFRGEIKQHPPVYSAIRIDGQHLYDLARKGKAPEKAPERTVTVHQFDLLSFQAPVASVRVHCSKGTYIRSLARDLGETLGTGACLSKLVREKAGYMSIENSLSLEKMKEIIEKDDWQSLFTDLTTALGFEKIEVDRRDAEDIFKGRAIELAAEAIHPKEGSRVVCKNGESGRFLLAVQNGVYVALLKQNENMGKPEVVFSDARVTS
ncbi:MAG: tRNA pseudouridine(55) synthase TruB [Candidatus Melainabacteria bacterium]|nr:MAG: tRNA pseudouridine(55) synthase TruB [Candidatus Melainabacteria bacterium]